MSGKFKNWELDHRSLFKQRLFWLMIVVPIVAFLILGYFAWSGSSLQLDSDGFNSFITRGRLPLAVLAMAIPLAAVISSIHRSIQTAEQIKHAEENKKEEKESRLSEAAEECLKKAYELITDDKGGIVSNSVLWKNAANLINEFELKKKRLKIDEIVERLEVEEDYWRAKFECLLDRFESVKEIEQIGTEPAIIFLVAKFSVWRIERPDTAPYSVSRKIFQKVLESLGGNQVIQLYLKRNMDVLVQQVSLMVMQSMDDLESPEEMLEEAIRSGDMSDPVVVELRQQREASLKDKKD